MKNPDLMTPDEAAKYLNISKLTLYGWTSKRKVPFRKVGRLIRFEKDELDNWTRRSEVSAFAKFFKR